MNLKFGRRNFLSALGAVGAGLFGSSKLSAVRRLKQRRTRMSSPGLPLVDGHPITTITKGFCSTGNPWDELGVTPMVNIQRNGDRHGRIGDEAGGHGSNTHGQHALLRD